MTKRIPNLITISRVILTCLLNAYILNNLGRVLVPIVISLLIFLSDFTDGKAARISGNTSRFGATFDVVADLFYIVASYGTLIYLKIAPFWFLTVILFKFIEFVITSFLLKRHSRVNAMFVFDFIGRFTIILFYVAPLLIYVSFQLSLTVNTFISQALTYGATATTITSTVYRIWKVVEQKELVKKVKYNKYICQKLNQ
ncbi:CDP-alcohol phosphatidyltransferase family protein [Sinanaerobacter sp. ZZT-01]|uniref:CDP-alcohol phosphatidyltransferase family protein n=1 Tax=Sinanaerobacter sp. ZZT-01 TaxID=3111540 RepID=UPI002D779466|nr:CDP-alcohol phosphatidyltransferase family protein [Sinanaerobacter sp. ZZT-01]WRR93794.1 CDP-alcohol phosphatidyltransferase family protein [Sinanaerobacter sp. ZZT-01]